MEVNNIGIIYACTNMSNGKMYVGQSVNFKHRKHKHKSDAFNQNNPQYNKRLYRSIRKYGWNNFVWEILIKIYNKDKCFLKKTMDYLERKFIFSYDTYKCGYNDTLGGDGNIGYKHTDKSIELIKNKRRNQIMTPLSEDTKLKISKSLMGYKISDETRAKISITNTGKKVRAATKAKISKNCASKRPEVASKISYALAKTYEVVTPHNEIVIVKNLKQYCVLNGLHNGHMSSVSKGKRSHHKGYKCKLLER